MGENQCLEGIIDLASFNQKANGVFILDWKTNQIARSKIGILRMQYLPQIAAYWKAVAEITNQPVSAGIYSTTTGQLVAYSENELAEEWERLRRLHPKDLAREIEESW